MTPINTLRKECERVRALAVTKSIVGEKHLSELLYSVVSQMCLLTEMLDLAYIEATAEAVGNRVDWLENGPDNDFKADYVFAHREWYRSLVHIALSISEEKRNELGRKDQSHQETDSLAVG